MSIHKIKEALRCKKISTRELLDEYYKRIRQYDSYNAFISLSANEAYKSADIAQAKLCKGCDTPLLGVPLAIKDNIITKGIKTTCGSELLGSYIPDYNATATERLISHNAIILGKTNMDEFGMGSDGLYAKDGRIKNPINPDRVSGGSSGGSACAVKLDLCAAALGTDTGGSIRRPASFSGCTGLNPTYGSVSRYGLISFASSLDRIGVIGKSALDCGIVFNTIKGKDAKDMTSQEGVPSPCKANKLAIIPELFDQCDKEVGDKVMDAIKIFRSLGYEIQEHHIPTLPYAVSAYYLISSAEASSNLSRYDGIRYGENGGGESYRQIITNNRAKGFGNEVKRRILLGTYALSEKNYENYYMQAIRAKAMITRELTEILSYCDAIISPTTPTTAYREDASTITKSYNADILTAPSSLAGLPSITTTCGYDKDGMPIGISITGGMFSENEIIRLCDSFEKELGKKESLI